MRTEFADAKPDISSLCGSFGLDRSAYLHRCLVTEHCSLPLRLHAACHAPECKKDRLAHAGARVELIFYFLHWPSSHRHTIDTVNCISDLPNGHGLTSARVIPIPLSYGNAATGARPYILY
jgi:hypothetical protein